MLLHEVGPHALAHLADNGIFAVHGGGQVYAELRRVGHCGCGHGGGGAQLVQALGGGEQGFGGRAAVVDAGAAQAVFLNEGHAAAGPGQGRGQRVAGLARTDNDGVESSSGHELG